MAEKSLFQIYAESNTVSPSAEDLTGLKFNSLTVEEFVRRDGHRFIWRCRCDCGAAIEAKGNNVKMGFKRHCGAPLHNKTYSPDHIRTFMKKRTVRAGDCLEWTGAMNNNGYGVIVVRGKIRQVHRVAYEMHKGHIADGLVVRHKCDNRICINPDHLELGTNLDNIADRVARRRSSSRLKETDVVEIKKQLAMARPMDGTQTRLAEQYGVIVSTICDINTGRSWARIPWPEEKK